MQIFKQKFCNSNSLKKVNRNKSNFDILSTVCRYIKNVARFREFPDKFSEGGYMKKDSGDSLDNLCHLIKSELRPVRKTLIRERLRLFKISTQSNTVLFIRVNLGRILCKNVT
jgi:hypothetical protein